MQNIGIEFPAQGEMAFFDLGSATSPSPNGDTDSHPLFRRDQWYRAAFADE